MANVTMHKSQDGRITFQIRISNGFDENKKRLWITKKFIPTKQTEKAALKEAQKYADEWENDLKNGKITSGCTIKFSVFLETWFNEWAVNNLSQKTAHDYKSDIERYALPLIGQMALMDIQKQHIQNVFLDMEKKKLSNGSIKKCKASLTSVFAYALDGRHLIAENPCIVSIKYTVKKQKKSEKVYNVFNPNECKRFLEYLDKRLADAKALQPNAEIFYQQQDIALFSLAIYSGFRRGEILALTWKDIDFKNNTIEISKNLTQLKGQTIIKEPKTESGYRTIHITSGVMDKLKEWKNTIKRYSISLGSEWNGTTGRKFDENHVFVSLVPHHYGKPLDMNCPSHKIRQFIKEYNSLKENKNQQLPKLCFHDLRHTHVTDLIAKGVQIHKISKRVGHKDIYVTLTTYAHYIKDDSDKEIADLYEDVI